MDSGDLLLQGRARLKLEHTVMDVLKILEQRITEELPERWRGLLAGREVLAEQNHPEATYCGQRIPEDGLIDWTRPALAVHNFIRAQTYPYPGALERFPTLTVRR